MGPSLAMNCIEIVGSSTVSGGRRIGSAIDVMVSPTFSSLIPVTATMSPAAASATSKRRSPWKVRSFCTRNSSRRPSLRPPASSTRSPVAMRPLSWRPMATKPR
jgi:hypothetical protein